MGALIWKPVAIGASAGAAALMTWALLIHGPGQYRAGVAAAESAVQRATIEQMKERGLINEAVRDTDLVDLCIELGGLPDDCAR